MILFLNGRFVPEEQAVVSVFDRGFLYGDGLFETLRISHGQPFRWTAHWDRLRAGAEFLKIPIPFAENELRASARWLVAQNEMSEGVLRLTLTRGAGPRGYSIAGTTAPNCVMSLHPLPGKPAGWHLVTVSARLPAGDPLARYKTGNKLLQILGRAEAETRGAHEALLLNSDGAIAEASSGNVFWIQAGKIYTPPLEAGILPGITRGLVIDLCKQLALPVCEILTAPAELVKTEGMFITLSSLGLMPVDSLDGLRLPRSTAIAKLTEQYDGLVHAETAKIGLD